MSRTDAQIQQAVLRELKWDTRWRKPRSAWKSTQASSR